MQDDYNEADKGKDSNTVNGNPDHPESMSRRKLLLGGATAAAGATLLLAGSNVFAAPVGIAARGSATTRDKEIRIGFISPRSGPLGLFGQSDPYNLELARKALAGGLTVGGETYRVTILDRDSQSSPARASKLARELVSQHDIHLMLTTSTPEVVNPVSDACEAAGVPSIGTDCPLESFFFGRGGKLGAPSPFKWSFNFSFGTKQFVDAYLASWPTLKTNKKVAVMYPNDADGEGFRNHLAPVLEKNGYTVIDPGAYQDGTTDYSSQIALFRREHCQIFNGVGIPPDIQAFWRQGAQLNFVQRLVIAQFAKAGVFPSQIMALGELGYNIADCAFWTPVFPYKSPLTGTTSQQLSAGYTKATGRQWTQQLGASMSLFEVGVAVLKAAKDPTNRSAIRAVIPTLDMITTVGRVNFKTGPYPNTAVTPEIGCQYVKTAPGSQFPLDLVTIGHAADPNVPIQRKLVPYHG